MSASGPSGPLVKEWHDKDIKNVIDLLNAEGQFYNFNELKDTYDIHGTFLDYQSILRKSPAFWNNKINQNSVKCKNLRQNVAQKCYIKILCKDKKGSRTIYDILIGNKDLTPPL